MEPPGVFGRDALPGRDARGRDRWPPSRLADHRQQIPKTSPPRRRWHELERHRESPATAILLTLMCVLGCGADASGNNMSPQRQSATAGAAPSAAAHSLDTDSGRSMVAPGNLLFSPSAQTAQETARSPAATDSTDQRSLSAVMQWRWRQGDAQTARVRRGSAEHASSGASPAFQAARGPAVHVHSRHDEAFRIRQAVSAPQSHDKDGEWTVGDRQIQQWNKRPHKPALAAVRSASWQGNMASMVSERSAAGRQLLADGALPFTVSAAQSGVRISSPQLRINSAPTQLFEVDFGKATVELNPINLFTITGAVE